MTAPADAGARHASAGPPHSGAGPYRLRSSREPPRMA
ncbi:hypothetical protein SUDANB37_03432 [Streptomyces sp. enrichment culture]